MLHYETSDRGILWLLASNSSEGSLNVFSEVLEASTEFTHCTVECLLRSEASIGFEGEHVSVLNFFEGDGVIKVAVRGLFPAQLGGGRIRGRSRD